MILRRVELHFNADAPEFVISESDRDPELYTALFSDMSDVDAKAMADCRRDFETGGFHPLGGPSTDAFLRRMVVLLSPRGALLRKGERVIQPDEPRIGRDPVLFVRRRTAGFAKAIEATLDDLGATEELSPALLRIIGVDVRTEISSIDPFEGCADESSDWAIPEDILLGKPANAEQIRIAKRLDSSAGVLVQGPPGTGKTHTIANLIGHLLAQGKSVLVTSHTAKALRVLREKVTDGLQPLCVSVLDSSSRKQLQDSVDGIVNRLSSSSLRTLENEAEFLAQTRHEIMSRISNARMELRDARWSEYREVVVVGSEYDPSDAARLVCERANHDGWIPTPVNLNEPLPLSFEELDYLYRTNLILPAEDEAELERGVPDVEELMSPSRFSDFNAELARLSDLLVTQENSKALRYWGNDEPSDDEYSAETLEILARDMESAISFLDTSCQWKCFAIDAGREGGLLREPWERLIDSSEQTCELYLQAREPEILYGPIVIPDGLLEEQSQIIDDIVSKIENGNLGGRLSLVVRPSLRRFIQACSVAGRSPSRVEDYYALAAIIKWKVAAEDFAKRWDTQIADLGGPGLEAIGQPFERAACEFVRSQVVEALVWYAESWKPIESRLYEIGFRFDKFMDDQPPVLGPYAWIVRLKQACSGPLAKELLHRAKLMRQRSIEARLRELESSYEAMRQSCRSQVMNDITRATANGDVEAYEGAMDRITKLSEVREVASRRKELLMKLKRVAPRWAACIEMREGVHGEGKLPGDPKAAWLWRQLNDELDRRGRIQLEPLQAQIEELTHRLYEVTNQLIERRAWAAQLRRTDLRSQQSLVSYAQIIGRIGKGKGKRTPRLRKEARKAMMECRNAVPVWIMPLSEVAETFDPRTTKFDVVIMDEASQCDLMGMIALYLGRKIIIVGDEEQVSPVAVGQDQELVQKLIDEHLQGIPFSVLYDGRMSVYDLAKASFGEAICLVEHFRCVPEIIGFSNFLSYSRRIRPLRDSSNVQLKPHVISYRVRNGFSENKVNKTEASVVASLVLSASEHSEYQDKTFGVISLVGDDQAIEIDRMIRSRMPEKSYARFQILCGNPAHFQGDERDVVFLSMVDGPQEGPLRMKTEGYQDMFKKRMNVAASRARDQMWIVYSLDPASDLKPGDLRRTMIEYAQDPEAFLEHIETTETRTESPFELEVLRRLMAFGYRVVPQWKVGGYRIDLVVEGDGKHLAVECDGDRYHTLDDLWHDNARQSLLERQGWKFCRIRGSEFFRNPDKAMEPVFKKLNDLGIPPEATQADADKIVTDSAAETLKESVIRRAAEIRALLEWPCDVDVIALDTSSADAAKRPDNVGRSADSFSVKVAPGCVPPAPTSTVKRTNALVASPRATGQPVPTQSCSLHSGGQEATPAGRNTGAEASGMVQQPLFDEDDDVVWASKIDPAIWFTMAHWAKVEDVLKPWERSLVYSVGRVIARGGDPTIKQARQARRVFGEAISLGFQPDTVNRNTQWTK